MTKVPSALPVPSCELDTRRGDRDGQRRGDFVVLEVARSLRSRIDGYVYFVRAGRAVKIGFSSQPEVRMSSLQLASPVELKPELLIPGTLALERAFHRFFRNDHLRGEWFRYSNAIAGYLKNCRWVERERARMDRSAKGVA